jgi:hypothetical protein
MRAFLRTVWEGGGGDFSYLSYDVVIRYKFGPIAIRVKRPGHRMEQLWETLPVIFIKNMGGIH